MTRIDILMATYNSEKYIIEQIDSILNQDYHDFHLFIKDDNSQDLTISLIKAKAEQHPSRITFIESKENRGVINNFSDLMRHAQADYIMFSDHDDVWLPNKVSSTFSTMRQLENNTHSTHNTHNTNNKKIPLLIHTDLTVVDSKLQIIDPSFWNYAQLNPYNSITLNRLLTQNVITGCTMMINRPLLALAHPIPQGVIMHDWWLGLVAASFGHIGIVPSSTLLYRQHQTNAVGAQSASILSEIKKLISAPKHYLSRIRQNFRKRYLQAQIFKEHYTNTLPQEQKMALEAFLKLHHTFLLNRAYLIFKHGFYKNGSLRTLRDIFFTL